MYIIKAPYDYRDITSIVLGVEFKKGVAKVKTLAPDKIKWFENHYYTVEQEVKESQEVKEIKEIKDTKQNKGE